MVAWKMRYVNSTNREEEMKWFWQNIDKEGYSLWDVYYEKFGSEGTVLYKTTNLKNGYLQRFDEFRKYVFGTYGVYGEEPKLETKGIWFFRGQEIPFILMDIPGSENHKFTKLDWNNEAHRKKTEESWLALG
jgi:elongation factor 1-gamma